MTVIERIRKTAREKKNISLTVLEQELHYSNGSLAKAKDIPSSRIQSVFQRISTSRSKTPSGRRTYKST